MKITFFCTALLLLSSCTGFAVANDSAAAQEKDVKQDPKAIGALVLDSSSSEEARLFLEKLIVLDKSSDIRASAVLGDIYLRGGPVAPDFEKAIEYYLRGAKDGQEWLFVKVGDIYQEGKLVTADEAKSVDFYKRAAAAKVPSAWVKLARAYLSGRGVARDASKAADVLKLAESSQDGSALQQLGDLYSDGTAVPSDVPKAIHFYEQAVKKKNYYAAMRLAQIYERGILVPKDSQKAAALYSEAAKENFAPALQVLAEASLYGRNKPQNVQEGIELLRKVSTLDPRNGFMSLADYYDNNSDSENTIVYLQRAAMAGNARSFVRLGEIYRDGVMVPADTGKAAQYFSFAANAGLPLGKVRLAEVMTKGQGLTADPIEASILLAEAMNSDDRNALMAVGEYLSRGEFTRPDGAKAIDAYQKAGDLGNARAYMRLGEIYRDGRLAKANPMSSINYFKRAEELGVKQAEVALAEAHVQHLFGSFSKPADGIKMLETLSAKGQHNAIVSLARLYYWGKELSPNPELAIKLLQQSAAAGNSSATSQLIAYYRDAPGDKIVRSIKTAETLLSTYRPQFDAGQIAKEEILISSAKALQASQYAEIVRDFDTSPPSVRREVLTALRSVNPNAFVYMVQSKLKARGGYRGALNGILTSETVRAFNRLCSSSTLAETCKMGPLSYEAAKVVSTLLIPL